MNGTKIAAAELAVAKARAAALFKAPYFGTVIRSFVYIAVPNAGTAFCTENLILGYDPKWALEATVDEFAADIVHEVYHVIDRHFPRSKHFENKSRWNIGADLAINSMMRGAGWKLAAEGPRRAIFPEDFNVPENLTAEEYYVLLEQREPPQRPEKKKGAAGAGEGDDSDNSDDAAAAADGKSNKSGGETPSAGTGAPGTENKNKTGVGQGSCGGVAGNKANEDLVAQAAKAEGVEGRSEVEVLAIVKKTAKDIEEYAKANGRGSVPGDLVDKIKKSMEPSKVLWQDELAEVLWNTSGQIQAGGNDFSLARPAKRSVMRGIPRPSLIEHTPVVAIIRDSSGSMGAPQLTAAVRESYSILEALDVDEIWFVDADTQISVPWKLVGKQFFEELTDRYGGGGTDFRQPIESALELYPRPDIIIYITDGDGTTTNMPPPEVEVVWCIVPGHYNKPPCDWGYVVFVNPEDETKKGRSRKKGA